MKKSFVAKLGQIVVTTKHFQLNKTLFDHILISFIESLSSNQQNHFLKSTN